MNEHERARFQQIVAPYLQDAFDLARWLTGSASDAEDIVQDACLRAYRGIAGYRGGNPRAWMMTIVRNTAYTWLKKHRDVNLVSLETTDGDDAIQDTDAATPESAMIERADAARLESAIASLPPLFRETLLLREVQGFDYRAIGVITGVPIGTVMSRLARARRQLARALQTETS